MAKREAVFAVLNILQKYDNPKGLTHNDIMNYLQDEYEIEFKREKFAAIIEQINSSEAYEVIYTRGRYSRYRLRLKYGLTSTEAELLCALIADTDVLSRLEADKLMDKLCITFKTSFESEEKIDMLKNSARSNKNEINGIDKLEIIDFAIKNKQELVFKRYDGKTFSDKIHDTPINWYMDHGDLIVNFYKSKIKLSEIIDLKPLKNNF